jgi:glucokinase
MPSSLQPSRRVLTFAVVRILAGDVGGTKTLLQLLDSGGEHPAVVLERRYESGLYPTFDAMLRDFLALGKGAVDSACFAVAGPVIDRTAEVTNLHWKMEADALRQRFGIGSVTLINDFHAVAVGVPLLEGPDLIALNEGARDRAAPIAILGAGTGLGEAIVIAEEEGWRVVASEGGHADFAPQGREQVEILLALEERYGHVSYERLLSGAGLVNIFTFLRDRHYQGDAAMADHSGDVESLPARISTLAAGGDPLACRAFGIFVDIYGAEAGNMALRLLARGGVFLAGGIAAKNVEQFTDGRFMKAFVHKGRFQEILRDIPVNLIANARVGLIGAAAMAEKVAN